MRSPRVERSLSSPHTTTRREITKDSKTTLSYPVQKLAERRVTFTSGNAWEGCSATTTARLRKTSEGCVYEVGVGERHATQGEAAHHDHTTPVSASNRSRLRKFTSLLSFRQRDLSVGGVS